MLRHRTNQYIISSPPHYLWQAVRAVFQPCLFNSTMLAIKMVDVSWLLLAAQPSRPVRMAATKKRKRTNAYCPFFANLSASIFLLALPFFSTRFNRGVVAMASSVLQVPRDSVQGDNVAAQLAIKSEPTAFPLQRCPTDHSRTGKNLHRQHFHPYSRHYSFFLPSHQAPRFRRVGDSTITQRSSPVLTKAEGTHEKREAPKPTYSHL